MFKFYFDNPNFGKLLRKKVYLEENDGTINEFYNENSQKYDLPTAIIIEFMFGIRKGIFFIEYKNNEELKELEFQYTMFKLKE